MRDVQMGLELRLRLKGYVAFLAARVVWAHEVRAREVDLQRLIVVIEHTAEVLTA